MLVTVGHSAYAVLSQTLPSRAGFSAYGTGQTLSSSAVVTESPVASPVMLRDPSNAGPSATQLSVIRLVTCSYGP